MSDQTKPAAFDLDGMLLHDDTVFEALARPLGRLDLVREFERLRVTDIDKIKVAHEKVAGWYEASALPELHSSFASI